MSVQRVPSAATASASSHACRRGRLAQSQASAELIAVEGIPHRVAALAVALLGLRFPPADAGSLDPGVTWLSSGSSVHRERRTPPGFAQLDTIARRACLRQLAASCLPGPGP